MRHLCIAVLAAAFIPLLSQAESLVIGVTDGKPFKGVAKSGLFSVTPLFDGGNYFAFSLSPDGRRCMWFEFQSGSLLWKVASYNSTTGVYDITVPEHLPRLERIDYQSPDLTVVGAHRLSVDTDAASGYIDNGARHFALLLRNSLSVVNLSTGRLVYRHVSPGIIAGPSWSNDGMRLAFFESGNIDATRSGGYQLKILDAGSLVIATPGAPSTSTAITFYPRAPLWTGGDTGLFYISNHSDKPGLRHAYHQKIDGGRHTRIWDRNTISISQDRRNDGIFLVDSQGCHRVKLSPQGNPETSELLLLPATLRGARYEFSPDGGELILMKAARLWYGNRANSTMVSVPGDPRGWVTWMVPGTAQ